MAGILRIRICRESFIEEIETMYHIDKKDYFLWVAQHIQNNPAFNIAYCDLDGAVFTHFIKVIKRFGDSHSGYYVHAANIIQELLQVKDIRIWTRKEVLEVKEALTISYDQPMQELFYPWLDQTKPGQVFICILDEK